MRINKFLHDNRNTLIVTIIAILIIILIIQLFNQNVKKENEKKMQEFENAQYVDIPSYEDKSSYSPITNQTITQTTTEQNINCIDTFINYCNNKQYENAYNTLSTECKELLFPTLEQFISNYCNKVFNEEKIYNLQYDGSISNLDTYNIRILKNPLTTGNYNEENIIEDYYTIVETEEGNKLNINKYIGRIQIGKTRQTNNITITTIQKDIYLDYERYKIKIENKTGKTLLLNGENTIGTAYGEDMNGNTYTSFIYELTQNEMIIENNFSKTIEIKLNKQYGVGNSIISLAFTNVILDYEEYKNLQNKEEYTNFTTVRASM